MYLGNNGTNLWTAYNIDLLLIHKYWVKLVQRFQEDFCSVSTS